MAKEPKLNRREVEAKIIARAWKDPKFAEELRRDPKTVVQRELAAMQPGAKLPANLDVQVLEETPTMLYLVVPETPKGVGDLSDDALARIAGGHGMCS